MTAYHRHPVTMTALGYNAILSRACSGSGSDPRAGLGGGSAAVRVTGTVQLRPALIASREHLCIHPRVSISPTRCCSLSLTQSLSDPIDNGCNVGGCDVPKSTRHGVV
jgi:hypothetical protein